MAYLTFEEFKEITGNKEVTDEVFKKYIAKSEALLDVITNNFYQFNDIEKDKIAFRVNRFKLALCAQIIYFSELKADTYESINKAPQSFSVGRTSISNTSRYSTSGSNESKSLDAEEVYIYLQNTGLLYRGVDR